MTVRQVAIRVLPPGVKRGLLRGADSFVDGVARMRVRRGRLGPLPDFVIIGGQKCGTTYLYERLVEHPLVFSCLVKEPHFFHYHFDKGVEWYRALFYAGARNGTPGAITGEASGSVFYPHAPRRVADVVPDAKLIALLRNPVERAYSHYFHEVRLGFEHLSFEEALEREEERLVGETDRILADETYFSFNRHHYSYRAKGIYWEQLERWLEHFPREQLLVLQSEEFYGDPTRVLAEVGTFLGLPPFEPRPYSGHKSFPYPRMNAATRAELVEYFRPHNERLEDLLGRELGWS